MQSAGVPRQDFCMMGWGRKMIALPSYREKAAMNGAPSG
jgi:hypothetical protein